MSRTGDTLRNANALRSSVKSPAAGGHPRVGADPQSTASGPGAPFGYRCAPMSEETAHPRLRRAYFECRYGQLHVHNAIPAGGGFDEKTTLVCLHASSGT